MLLMKMHEQLIFNEGFMYFYVHNTFYVTFYVLLVCVYYDPPAIIIFMFYLPIHTLLVVKFVVALGKRVLHFMYTVCLQG